jgi:hypothetical protein
VISASSTRRWVNCALSARLPQEPDDPGPAAKIGTRFHSLIEERITAGKWVPLEPLDEHFEPPLRAGLEWLNANIQEPCEVLVEQAYELAPLGGYEPVPGKREPHWRDAISSKSLGKIAHRSYPDAYARVYGTADVVVLGKDSVHIIDWKTGQKSKDHPAQIRTLSLMVAEERKATIAKSSAVYVNLKTSKVTEQTEVLDSFDLHVHAGAIVSTMKDIIATGHPEPVPGDYCFHCPAIGCPIKAKPKY